MGSPPSTLKTLSKALGLSVTTVSRALKDGPEVRPETIAIVKKAAKEMGYTPNLRGVKLKTGKSFAICAALSTWNSGDVGDAGSVALVQGVQSALESTLYNLIAMNIKPNVDAMSVIQNIVSQKLADGIILDQVRPQDPRLKYLLEKDFPFVTYGRSELYTPHPYFDIDDEAASYEAATILLGRGHKRIALFNAPEGYTFAQNRLRGYTKALTDAQIAYDASIVSFSDIDAARLRLETKALCGRPDRPTAFLSPNEVATLAISAGIRDAGLEPGPNAEIISRDGTAFGAYLNPPVSAQYHPLQYTGEKLAGFLLRRIEGEAPESLQEVAHPKFIDRFTSA